MDLSRQSLIEVTQKEHFLQYESALIVHPIVHDHFTRDEILSNLLAEIDADLQKGTDAAFAERFLNHCPVDGASVTDYMIKHIEIEPGFDVLAGIRFRGLDLNRPFVAILHRSRSFDSEPHLRKIMTVLKDEFAVFKPKAVLFYQSSHDKTLPLREGDKDKRILMGVLEDIASIPVTADISIVKAAELDFYDRYRDEYAVVSQLTPDYFRAETAEREEDMEDCVKNHLTYKVYIGGEFAGVFIVTESTFLGTKGFYVIENLLFEKFRGKKHSPSLQSTVAKELLSFGGKVLFGSIYPTNYPSYNAALSSKRIDIGGNYMITIG